MWLNGCERQNENGQKESTFYSSSVMWQADWYILKRFAKWDGTLTSSTQHFHLRWRYWVIQMNGCMEAAESEYGMAAIFPLIHLSSSASTQTIYALTVLQFWSWRHEIWWRRYFFLHKYVKYKKQNFAQCGGMMRNRVQRSRVSRFVQHSNKNEETTWTMEQPPIWLLLLDLVSSKCVNQLYAIFLCLHGTMLLKQTFIWSLVLSRIRWK